MNATNSTEEIRELNDGELLNRVVPRWAQALNWLYEHTFGPLDRLIDTITTIPTKRMIAVEEAREANKK